MSTHGSIRHFCFAGRTFAQTPQQNADQVQSEKQSYRITGVVLDEENLPLIGATITVDTINGLFMCLPMAV